jgi:hypothetical protein
MKFYPGDRVQWADGTKATVVPRFPESQERPGNRMYVVIVDGETCVEGAMESSLTLIPNENALAIRRLEGKPLSVEQQEKLAEAYNGLFVRAYESEKATK